MVLTLLVPLVIGLYSAEGWKAPGLAAQYASMARWPTRCMPQVFFYGVHVLAGQVLNARDRFGPMMWAPIANNVVSSASSASSGRSSGAPTPGRPSPTRRSCCSAWAPPWASRCRPRSSCPFLRAAGYRYRPRWDFRHTGLGNTFRLAKWTLGFVLVTQPPRRGEPAGHRGHRRRAWGRPAPRTPTRYAVWILPHSLVTVSLATAMLPSASRLGAAGDRAGVAEETTRTARLATTVLLPAAVAFCALGLPPAQLTFGFGRGAGTPRSSGRALMALALGLVPFTMQYICCARSTRSRTPAAPSSSSS